MSETPVPAASPRPLSQLGLEILIDIPSAAEFAEAAREWFSEVPRLLAAEEWEEVLREARPPFKGKPQAEWLLYDDWREPFTLWADIVVAPLKWRGMRVWHRRATARNLEWLTGQLGDRPVSATLAIRQVDANGIELPGGLGVAAQADLDAADNQVPVGRLSVGDSLAWHPYDHGDLSTRVAALARVWADKPKVLSLFAGEEVPAVGGTALSRSLEPRMPWWDAALSRDLQGYSWITLCPPGVAARLGGARALAATGAFWRVEEMAGGSVLLQATEHAADYGITQARKAFEALAPALPAGTPERPANWPADLPWLVIPENPARRG